MKKMLVVVATLVVVAAFAVSAGAQTQMYTPVDLRMYVPVESRAAAVNDRGDILVVGASSYLVRYGVPGAVRLEEPAGFKAGPNRMNNLGVAVGAVMANDKSIWYGAVWARDGRCTVVPQVKHLQDINDTGLAVGITEDMSLVRLVNTLTGEYSDIGQYGFPYAINNTGTVAGATWQGGNYQPCLWINGGTNLLPTLGYGSWPCDLNDNEVAVGVVTWGDHAVIWKNGTCQYLPDFGGKSWAEAVNNSGVAVGVAYSGSPSPVVWKNGGVAKLPVLSGTMGGHAYGVNDAGWIAGVCYDYSWRQRPVLWLPIGRPRPGPVTPPTPRF